MSSPPRLLINGRTFYTSRGSFENVNLHSPNKEDNASFKDEAGSSIGEKIPLTGGLSHTDRKFSRFLNETSAKCTLQKGNKHGWKPETMRAPVLLGFATASLLIAALIETLAQEGQRAGGLSIVNTAEDLPSTVSFVYLYLPTIIAVIYSLIWNWIDLDVKRIQPWLELSKHGGASGRTSLFLDYPFDFVASVPFKAAKRKHWPVFCSSTVTVMIFWVITPLQSAILGTGPILVSRLTAIQRPSLLLNSSAQAALFDQSILNDGYAMNWLNQSLPPYTTAGYALLPFEPVGRSGMDGSLSNWTGVTTKYWTELSCWAADATPMKIVGIYNFYDGRGCNVTNFSANTGIIPGSPYDMHYVGWENNGWAEQTLSSPTCGIRNKHKFLATWVHQHYQSGQIQVAATFCETAYKKQEVQVTMDAASLYPTNYLLLPLSSVQEVPDTEFNASAFEVLLGAGVSPVDIPRDKPFTTLVESYSRLQGYGIGYPLYPLAGIAIGMRQNVSLDQYSKHSELQQLYEPAHQALFSVAFSRELANTTIDKQTTGLVRYVEYGVVVSRLFATTVEAILILVAFLTLWLWWLSFRTRCMLCKDPASLDVLIDIVRDSTDMLDRFSGKGHLSEKELLQKLGSTRFQLKCACQSSSLTPTLAILEDGEDLTNVSREDSWPRSASQQTGHYSPIKPTALRRRVGTLFGIILCISVAILAGLKAEESSLEGLKLPSTNMEINLIITSFIPTVFSTLMEPFWVLLNRLLCILQPFQDLQRRNQTAARSLQARYTAVPPQMAFWRAFRSGHYFLAGVCIIALSANVLSVGLGGLFNNMPVRKDHTVQIYPQRQLKLSSQGVTKFTSTAQPSLADKYVDPFYIMMANLSSGTTLPPWTTSEFVFLPVTIPLNASFATSTYEVTTYGFGVEPNCQPFHPVLAYQPPVFDTSVGTKGRYEDGCPSAMNLTSVMAYESDTINLPEGRAAFEIVKSNAFPYTFDECDRTIVFGWARAEIHGQKGAMNTSYMVCRPDFKSARFNVTIDVNGYISKATATSGYSSQVDFHNATLHRTPLFSEVNNELGSNDNFWHNNTIATDWFNYMVKLYTKSEALLDPNTPTPDAHHILPAIEGTYKMIYAMYFGLSMGVFEEEAHATPTPGSRIDTETRIFISTSALITSITILGLYIVAVVVFYVWAIKAFLPRMPTTIGSLLAYIAPSTIVREHALAELHDRHCLAFGRFVGSDGRAHIGIELADRVMPVKPSALERGDTRPVSSFVGRALTGTRKPKLGDTW